MRSSKPDIGKNTHYAQLTQFCDVCTTGTYTGKTKVSWGYKSAANILNIVLVAHVY